MADNWRLIPERGNWQEACVVDLLYAYKLAHDAGYDLTDLSYCPYGNGKHNPFNRLLARIAREQNYRAAYIHRREFQWEEDEFDHAFGEESNTETYLCWLLDREMVEFRLRLPKVERLCTDGHEPEVLSLVQENIDLVPLETLLNDFGPGPPPYSFLIDAGLLRSPGETWPVGIYVRMADDHQDAYEVISEHGKPRYLDLLQIVKTVLAIDRLYPEKYGNQQPGYEYARSRALDWAVEPLVLTREMIGIDDVLALFDKREEGAKGA